MFSKAINLKIDWKMYFKDVKHKSPNQFSFVQMTCVATIYQSTRIVVRVIYASLIEMK